MHARDKFEFVLGMHLKWLSGRRGKTGQGLQRTLVIWRSEVDIGSVFAVLSIGTVYTVFLGMGEQRLVVFHVLGYIVYEACIPFLVVTETQSYYMDAQVSPIFSV